MAESKPEPRWDIDWKRGEQGELWVSDIREAFAKDAIEVKSDYVAAQTGNIYIEYECLRQGKWKPSGIATTESPVYAIAIDRKMLLVLATDFLKAVAKTEFKRNPSAKREMLRGSHPTRGIVVPISSLVSGLKDKAA